MFVDTRNDHRPCGLVWLGSGSVGVVHLNHAVCVLSRKHHSSQDIFITAQALPLKSSFSIIGPSWGLNMLIVGYLSAKKTNVVVSAPCSFEIVSDLYRLSKDKRDSEVVGFHPAEALMLKKPTATATVPDALRNPTSDHIHLSLITITFDVCLQNA